MAEQQKTPTQKLPDSTPNSRQAVKFVTAATIGGLLLVLSCLTLTGTVISLVMATPLLVLFSPILIPAGIVIFLAVTGFLFSGGFGIAAVSALSWIYEYVSGKHPPGSDQLDYARMRLANKARDVKDRAYSQYAAQNKPQSQPQQQDVTQSSS
ncbi:oleosin Cor a 13-like [Tasmannia lanceolata]|uniref:oleosin Cor a 13-like n=1 Tax=Tasmannia lanceolata TaxID=3420 RepID=UPI004063A327